MLFLSPTNNVKVPGTNKWKSNMLTSAPCQHVCLTKVSIYNSKTVN